ncbi:hypothetical protein [Sinomonas humi]|uniref:Uncharacterized protein n=1 Tax=Sinomonas humi TaxID=1338436 RepID=A0A0B2AED0_9MICC|nr:hypothetical protein [Sinomonas humi]KHL01610.1 hypothetical protein LK10_15310 [Sinomonas humi]
MKDLELVAWNPQTRGGDFHIAASRYPIDRWRAVLPEREGFTLLEHLEHSYSAVEHVGSQFAADPSDVNKERFKAAERRWSDARVAFANYSRKVQSSGYTQMVLREEREQIRRDVMRHPVTAMKRLRLNARERKSAG